MPVRQELMHRAIDSRDPITAELNESERAIVGAVELVEAAISRDAELEDALELVRQVWRCARAGVPFDAGSHL